MQKLLILYDGHCNFCMASVDFVKSFDWLNRLELKDAQLDKSYKGLKISKKRALEEVHLWDGTKAHAGYFAFRRLAWAVPLFWPMLLILYIPGVPFIGKHVYKYISQHRLIFGCNSEACRVHSNHKRKK